MKGRHSEGHGGALIWKGRTCASFKSLIGIPIVLVMIATEIKNSVNYGKNDTGERDWYIQTRRNLKLTSKQNGASDFEASTVAKTYLIP